MIRFSAVFSLGSAALLGFVEVSAQILLWLTA